MPDGSAAVLSGVPAGNFRRSRRVYLLRTLPAQPRNSLSSELAQSTSFGSSSGAKRESTSALLAANNAPCDAFSAEDRAYYELEQALQYPVLPPNPHFFCCFDRFHITAVAKLLSAVYMLIYAVLCYVSYESGHAAAFLISLLVCVSVGCCLVYGVCQWSKICLVPFFLLQVMLVLYTAVWLALLAYAALNPGDSYLFNELHRVFDNWLGLCTQLWCWLVLATFAAFLAFMLYTALLMWYEYQFIAEVDHFLKSIKKSSSNVSKENHDAQGNARLKM